MVELEKNKLVIRDKIVNKIFDNTYKVFVKELMNPDIKPGVTFEEQKIIIGRLDDLFLQQKMELYNTYFFEENIKPVIENMLELIRDVADLPKPKKKPQDTSYVQ